jgi:hypothetical protein
MGDVLASLDESPSAEVDAAWDAEIQRRLAEVESAWGEGSVHPGSGSRAASRGEVLRTAGCRPGKRFTHEIEAALALACSFPEIGPAYKYGTRRVYPKRFPFSVVYRLLGEEIVVVAIAPFYRKPGYWRARADVA